MVVGQSFSGEFKKQSMVRIPKLGRKDAPAKNARTCTDTAGPILEANSAYNTSFFWVLLRLGRVSVYPFFPTRAAAWPSREIDCKSVGGLELSECHEPKYESHGMAMG